MKPQEISNNFGPLFCGKQISHSFFMDKQQIIKTCDFRLCLDNENLALFFANEYRNLRVVYAF